MYAQYLCFLPVAGLRFTLYTHRRHLTVYSHFGPSNTLRTFQTSDLGHFGIGRRPRDQKRCRMKRGIQSQQLEVCTAKNKRDIAVIKILKNSAISTRMYGVAQISVCII